MSIKSALQGPVKRMQSVQTEEMQGTPNPPTCPKAVQNPDGSCPTKPDVITGGKSKQP